MDELLIISPALALISALAITPLVIKLALKYGLLEQPKAGRWHERPVALMGGIAIYFSWLLGVGVYGFEKLYGILAGSTLMLAVGWMDDRYEIGPMAKVAAQLAAGGILLIDGFELGYGMFDWHTIPLTLGWIVLVTNAFNLLDNMDGLAPGVAMVSSAAMGFMAWSLGAVPAAVAAWSLSAASGGFLFFNFHPARIFMGDTGSQFVGFLLAAFSLAVPLHVTDVLVYLASAASVPRMPPT
jgi:UDP-GlcNAc:undecaprenyl-phosphate GlcNAc-1-phosphate transferase